MNEMPEHDRIIDCFPGESQSAGWGLRWEWGAGLDRIQYGLLVFAAICQAITVGITWPLWQTRSMPPNLPTVDLPPFSFGWLMIVSLVATCCLPRRGLLLHWIVLLLASFFDQFRLQPQFYASAVLMTACVWDRGRMATRWLLAAMWLWAGLHKAVSPDWFGHGLHWMTSRTDWSLNFNDQVLAWGIALIEIGVGLLACFRPRWAAVPCAAMHAGIVVTLSPLLINWNSSVIPWNLATAVIGSWVMWQSVAWRPQAKWEIAFAAVCLLSPFGFYVGWVDHGFANVLYSGSLPRGLITTRDGIHSIQGWGKLAVPFPNEHRTLRVYFEQYSQPGDKLHIADPRTLMDDGYFVLGSDHLARKIDADAFFAVKSDDDTSGARSHEVAGIGLDSQRAIFALQQAGVRMVRPALDQPVNAVAFTKDNFDPALLSHLPRLPNLNQVQLAGTSVQDQDLQWLSGLKLLTGIGLDQTNITDAGLVHLQGMPYLQYIEHEGTAITADALKKILSEPF